MHRSRPAVLLVPVIAALALAALPSVRKDANGVYGVIDRVVFEPTEEKAERIQVWGVFAMADNIGIENDKISYIQVGGFHPPQRGYLYYTVNRRDETVTRAEWSALKAFAGTGQAVAFGGAFPPPDSAKGSPELDLVFARRIMTYNGRLRRSGEAAVAPDTFPLRMAGADAKFRNVTVMEIMRADPARAAKLNLFSVP